MTVCVAQFVIGRRGQIVTNRPGRDMQNFRVKVNHTVRQIEIEIMRGPLLKRHHDIVEDFYMRRIYYHYRRTGPAPKPKSEGGPYALHTDRSLICFDIDEQYADEYLKRIRAPIKKSEQEAYDRNK